MNDEFTNLPFHIATSTLVKTGSGYIDTMQITAPPTINTTVVIYDATSIAETVTNGAFASDTAWTKGTGWAIAAGVATKTAGTASVLSQTTACTPGELYQITFTVSAYSAGAVTAYLGGTAGSSVSADATYIQRIKMGTTDSLLSFSANAACALSIDDVSVIPAPMFTTVHQGITVVNSVYCAPKFRFHNGLYVKLTNASYVCGSYR